MDPMYFFGQFTKIRVIDPAAPPIMVANNVIDPTKPWSIEVEWKLEGFFVPLYLAALGGNWVVEAYADAMGPGQEKRIAVVNVPVGPAADPKTYSATLPVLAGEVQEHTPGGPSGIYRLTVSAFLNSTLGLSRLRHPGFADGVTFRAEETGMRSLYTSSMQSKRDFGSGDGFIGP